MSGQLLHFYDPAGPLAKRRAEVARSGGLQMDFATLLGKLERCLRWLDRHQIHVAAFSCSTFRGPMVYALGPGKLRQLLREEMVSRGHVCSGGLRTEKWQAMDPSTGVLICWEEEARA